MSYHNGSVWPHDTALCAAGMARYGARDGVARLLTELFEAAVKFDMRRPEPGPLALARLRGPPMVLQLRVSGATHGYHHGTNSGRVAPKQRNGSREYWSELCWSARFLNRRLEGRGRSP